MFAIRNHLWIYFFSHWRRRRGSILRSNVYCIYVWKLCGSFCRYPISGHFLSPTGKANSIPFQRPFGLFAFPHSLFHLTRFKPLKLSHQTLCCTVFITKYARCRSRTAIKWGWKNECRLLRLTTIFFVFAVPHSIRWRSGNSKTKHCEKKKKNNNKSGTRNHNGLREESIIQIGFLYKSLAPSAREERQRNQL